MYDWHLCSSVGVNGCRLSEFAIARVNICWTTVFGATDVSSHSLIEADRPSKESNNSGSLQRQCSYWQHLPFFDDVHLVMR